ncbi:Phage shock protein PspC (stress-responsive transcriptional regulator) [Thermostaphylospora chromogena]|uniref:Phage shock protein PspC (Stress-responsive transcriptional regulator) n=2 Tax=Thermostaphylospora chromogena TaxID=35622 RepID=A0A1H1EA01_9ACTN|nr:Phage shock protein PspC (stress-responsive transcriptional regulator) [Thermostaphylospora chromogena]
MVSAATARDDGVMTDTGNDDREDARAADGSPVDHDATPPRDGGPGTPAADVSDAGPPGEGRDGAARSEASQEGAPRDDDTPETGADPHGGSARQEPPRTGGASQDDTAVPGRAWTDRVLARSSDGRILFGVCAGLGRFTGIDPVLFRVGFGVLVLGSGIGFFLYLAAFLLMRGVHGEPGYVEQWTRRSFDAETVMALLCGVFAFGLVLNVASGGIGSGTVVVGTLLAIALLAAHTADVDVFGLLRSLPERLSRRTAPTGTAPTAAPPYGTSGEQPPTTVLGTPAGVRPAGATATPSPGPEPSPSAYAAAAHASPGITRAYETPVEQNAPGGGPGAERFPRQAAQGGYDSSGTPFAPHGPYTPAAHQPPGFQGGVNRPWPYGYGAPATAPAPQAPARRRRPRRPRTFVGTITMVLAVIVGGIVMAAQPHAGIEQPQLVGGAMLLTIGLGLLVTTWFGRGAGLVVAGALVAFVISIVPVLNDVPHQVGGKVWQPTTVAEASRPHRVGVGDGLLDLSVLELPEGARVPVRAHVSVGDITVILPPDVRAEVNLVSRVGDIEVGNTLTSGPAAEVERVLEPEVQPKGKAATIVLTVRANVGNVEVRRAA